MKILILVNICLLAILGCSGSKVKERNIASVNGQCGLAGRLSQRIEDCSAMFPNYAKQVSDSKNMWMLVSQDEFGKQLWYDNSTDLVWSDFRGEATQLDAKKICGSLDAKIFHIPAIEWMLPSGLEFSTARRNGIAEAVSKFNQTNYWTSTSLEVTRGIASVYFKPKTGDLQGDEAATMASVRCVGHVKH